MPADSISPLESKAPLLHPINITAASQSIRHSSLAFRYFDPLPWPRNLQKHSIIHILYNGLEHSTNSLNKYDMPWVCITCTMWSKALAKHQCDYYWQVPPSHISKYNIAKQQCDYYWQVPPSHIIRYSISKAPLWLLLASAPFTHRHIHNNWPTDVYICN